MLAYLDHAATAPLRPEAREAMLPWLGDRFGNPSGSHQVARAAKAAIEEARDLLAAALGVEPGGVVLTSGGTEADNLAVLGSLARRPGAVVVSGIEHPAVVEAALASGREVRVAAVTAEGLVDLERLDALLDEQVALVSVQLANHEVGTIQPIAEIARIVREKSPAAVLHTDAVAALPFVDIAYEAASADLISVSSHKIGGPQGVGALAFRPSRSQPPAPTPRGGARSFREGSERAGPLLSAVLHGGGQERGLRSGTHNVAGIVGFAAAAAATAASRQSEVAAVSALRDRLARLLMESLPAARETAAGAPRLAGHLHLLIPGVESEALLVLLDEAGVCASAGAACASGAMEPSPVLLAMGVPEETALCSLRLTLGPTTTEAEVDLAASVVPEAVSRLLSRTCV